jgi:hypothetical protein
MSAKRSMRGARNRRKRASIPAAPTTGRRGENPTTRASIAPKVVMAERPRKIFIDESEYILVFVPDDGIGHGEPQKRLGMRV